MMNKVALRIYPGLLVFSLLTALAVPSSLAQDMADIREIQRPDLSPVPRGESVRSVRVFQRGRPETGKVGLRLGVGAELTIEKPPQPELNYVRVAELNDDWSETFYPGANVRLVGENATEVEGGLYAWAILKRIRATARSLATRLLQATARGTQYGFQFEPGKTKLFVWEGAVEVANQGTQQPVSVGALMITEADRANRPPTKPRLAKFEEVKNLLVWALEIEPAIRLRLADVPATKLLHEDLIRQQFNLKRNPRDAQSHVRVGNIYVFLDRLDEASAAYDRAEQLSPGLAQIYNGRGVIAAFRGDYQQATDFFHDALQREKTSQSWNNLGAMYLLQGVDDQATDAFNAAIRLDRENYVAYNSVGLLRLRQQRWSEAETALKQSLTLKDRLVARNTLGNVYLLQGREAAAESEYQRALQVGGDDPITLHNLGVFGLRKGEQAEAIARFQRAQAMNPQDPAPYNGLGLVYLRQDQLDQAIEQFITAMRVAPADGIAYYNLGLLYVIREDARRLIVNRLSQEAISRPQPMQEFVQRLEGLTSFQRETWDQQFELFRNQAKLRMGT